MRFTFARKLCSALVVLFILASCLAEAGAQTRRRKRSRRVTNPVTNRASSSQTNESQTMINATNAQEPQIISTSEDQSNEGSGGTDTAGNATNSGAGNAEGGGNANTTGARRSPPRGQRNAASSSDEENMRRTVNRLSTQVNQLTNKLSQMEEQQRTLVNLERLSRAEQRAESLRAQLREVQEKEADLQGRAEQLDYALQPENLDNALAGFGSTRPEVAREQRRRQLESERSRVRAQLDQLANNRTRLEEAIAHADAEADKIRQLVDVPTTTANGTTGTTNTTDSNTTNDNGNNAPPRSPTQTDTTNSNPPR